MYYMIQLVFLYNPQTMSDSYGKIWLGTDAEGATRSSMTKITWICERKKHEGNSETFFWE